MTGRVPLLWNQPVPWWRRREAFFVLCVKGAPYSHQDTSGLPEGLDPHAGTQLPRKPLDLPSSSDLAATGTESRMETSLPYETCCAGSDPRTIASCMHRFASE